MYDINLLCDLYCIEVDDSYEMIFYASWSDYEEFGWLAILQKNSQFYLQSGGYCVMSDGNVDAWFPQQISVEEALEYMIEWEKWEVPSY